MVMLQCLVISFQEHWVKRSHILWESVFIFNFMSKYSSLLNRPFNKELDVHNLDSNNLVYLTVENEIILSNSYTCHHIGLTVH